MNEESNLFDFVEAKRRKEEAIVRVDANADEDWKSVALKAVGWVAMTHITFTTDDVWLVLSGRDASTHESRALGAVMLRAAKIGYIESTDQYRPSIRPEAHQRPVKIWKSLLMDAPSVVQPSSN